jgi:hypothetical protein
MKTPSKRPKRNTAKLSGLNPHDKFARKTLGDPLIAADVLRHYTEPVIAKYVDLDNLKPEPTQNFGKKFQELVKDIAFASHLIDKKGKAEVLIIAEHKSTPEPFVLLQLLVYLVLTWYKRWQDAGRPQSTKKFRLPLPILVVLYNGKEDWNGELDIKNLVASVPPELEPFILKAKIVFIRLNRFDKKHLPGKPETQAVIESMIRATDGTFVAGLESVLGHFKGASIDDRIEELIKYIVSYCDLVEVVTPDDVDTAITHTIQGQRGIKMAQAVKKGIWATGYEEGESRGRAEGRAGSITRFLIRRFRTVPKSVRDRVCSITDIDRLDELTDQAVDCPSLAEFAKALNTDK